VEKFIFFEVLAFIQNLAPQPLKEEVFITDTWNRLTMVCYCKITGVKACQAIRKQFNKDYVSLDAN
jgi:GDP-L-fucose synthase